MIRWATRTTVDRRMGPVPAEVAAAAAALIAPSVNGDGARRWAPTVTDLAAPAPDHPARSSNCPAIRPLCGRWNNSPWSCPTQRCRTMLISPWNSWPWYVHLYLYISGLSHAHVSSRKAAQLIAPSYGVPECSGSDGSSQRCALEEPTKVLVSIIGPSRWLRTRWPWHRLEEEDGWRWKHGAHSLRGPEQRGSVAGLHSEVYLKIFLSENCLRQHR